MTLKYTTTEVAEYLGCNPATIRRWADKGLIPHKRNRRGEREFSIAVIKKFKKRMGKK